MRYFLVILVLCSACSLQNFNRASLALGTVSLACDWAQTRSLAEKGWGPNHEANPVMGEHPSTEVVDAYFVSVAVINAAIYLLMSEKIRSLPQAALVGIQTDTIIGNADPRSSNTICGFRR